MKREFAMFPKYKQSYIRAFHVNLYPMGGIKELTGFLNKYINKITLRFNILVNSKEI